MVTNKILKRLKYASIEEYYDQIILFKIKGDQFSMFQNIRTLDRYQAVSFTKYIFRTQPKPKWKQWVLDILETKI